MILDRCQGCLIGGAAGDALGYEIEFDRLREIVKRYGKEGITEYELHNGKALVSDDTQMTLFTAEGLLLAEESSFAGYRAGIRRAYMDWIRTQYEHFPLQDAQAAHSKLLRIPELFAWRAPGNTCLSAIEGGCDGSVAEPVNQSKGCGGVMRVAPIGLLSPDKLPEDEADRLGAEAAALTHGHDLGYLPAMVLVHMVRKLVYADMTMHEAAESAIAAMERLYPKAKHLKDLTKLLGTAVKLADDPKITPVKAYKTLGEGWVGDEALAVALFCAVRYEEDFDGAMIASVNHDGDSDSTGAVCGNLLGARLGLNAIPQKYILDLELRSTLMQMGASLAG
ncbi:MAG: ADP-ribosylglycohydrolase family protein [Oscillospiraceae bacterium]|nr:ADP-ribosylglycohydrolase family protein [Oscillospiraceae bacterium]